MEIHGMEGKTVVVSGGSSGVGLAGAKGMAQLGAKVLLLTRSADRGRDAVTAVKSAVPGADVAFMVADLTSPSSVRALIEGIGGGQEKIDVLLNAAGSVGEEGEIRAGIPRSFATNALTHFLLTREALPLLRQSPTGRVLTVGATPALIRRLRGPALDGIASDASAGTVISQSLAWKLILARHVSSSGTGVAATVFHPGLIKSELLSQRSAPLRLFGTLANLFASERCEVIDHLASSPVHPAKAPVMVDQRSLTVQVPSSIQGADSARVWAAAEKLADRLSDPA